MKKVFIFIILILFGNCRFPSLEKSVFELLSLLQFQENRETYSLTVQVSDLLGEGLTLSNNGESLTISENGSHTFSGSYKRNETYNVVVSQQPSNPDQNCEVSGGTGNFLSGNVNTIQVNCGEGLIPISGTVNNLSGSGLQIANTTSSGTETLDVNSTSFAFPSQPQDSTYNLSIVSQPTDPWQTCSITAPSPASGNVTGTGITITIDCVTNEFPLSVQVIGIGGPGTLAPGGELQIQVNGGETLLFDGDGTSSFPTNLPSGTAYSLAILNTNSEVATGTCSIPSPNGTIQGTTETAIVNCSAGFTISGTVTVPAGYTSSILGTGLTLRLTNTGGTAFANQDMNLNAGQTNFTFATAVPVGGEYQITILTQPNTLVQNCTVSGTGTGAPIVIPGSVTDISVNCSLPLPEFVTGAGNYPNTVNVTLIAPITGAEIRYELGNGTQPNPLCASSPIYGANIPITDNANKVIKVVQCSPDWTTPSAVVTSGIYNLKVATPTSSIADGSSIDQNDTAVFSTTTTAPTWNCWRDADAPTAAVDPGCGGTANTCNAGDSIGNYIHPGLLDKNVKVRTCRLGFEQSDILALRLNMNTYSISGTIAGLTTPFANDFVLRNNGGDDLNITANGSFTFPTAIASGAGYNVTRFSGPTNPWQNCVLTNTAGTITNANITNVTINCSLQQYTVSGTITGPSTGDLNPGTSITIDPGASVGAPIVYNPGDAQPDFGSVDSGTPIDLQITSQPQGQHCVFVNPLGLVGEIQGGNLNIDINCVSGQFTAGGNVQLTTPKQLGFHLFRGSLEAIGVGNPASGYLDDTLDAARFNAPRSLAFDGTFFYVADALNHRIRRVDSNSAAVTTFAGDGTAASINGPGTSASFHIPHGLALDGTYLYVSDRGSHRIRRVHIPTAQVSTLAGSIAGHQDGFGTAVRFNNPYGLAIHNNFLYIADTDNHRIRRLNLNSNEVTTYIGDGTATNTDGVGTGATIQKPIEMVVIGDLLYVTSMDGHCIRRIDLTDGTTTTIAGSPGNPGHIDAIGLNARLRNPHGLATDGSVLYFTEVSASSNRIRSLNLTTQEVTTLAGSDTQAYQAGVGARGGLNAPVGIGTNGDSLYFTEDHGIRLLTSDRLDSHFPMSGNLINYSRNGTDLNFVEGTQSYDLGRFGEADGSLAFDGATRYDSQVNVTGNYELLTVAGWIKWDGSPGDLRMLFHLGSNPKNDGLGLYIRGTGSDPNVDEKLYVRYSNQPAERVNNFKVRANEWIHLAITRANPTSPVKIYANGKLIYSRPFLPGTPGGGNNFRVGGSDQLGGEEYFTGNITEVRYYSRILNEGEINELAKDATQSLVGHTYNANGAVGLLAHYNFNTIGQFDLGPHPNHANTLVGTPIVARGTDGTFNSARYTKDGSYQTNAPVHGLPTGSAPRTVCSWVKPDQLPALGTNQVVTVYGEATNLYGLSLRNNTGIQSIVALNTGGNQEANYTLPLHTWTHICTAFNGTEVAFYAGGRQLGAGVPMTVNTILTGTSSLTIGSNFGTGENFTGKLDDIRIYNRALTLAEIRRLGTQNYNGLVARFDFEGDNSDVSGFGTILTTSGTAPILSEDRLGNPNSAYLFDGSNFYRTSAANPYLPLPEGTSPLSMCAWVRADQTVSGIRSAVGYGSGTALENIWLGVRNLDSINPTPEVCSLGIGCAADPRFSPHVWEHLCVAQSETDAKLFYNGRQISSPASTTWNKVATNLMIGSLNNNYRFPGSIDEVTIYNRELGADEIRAMSGYHPFQTTAWNPVPLTSRLKLYLQADSLSALNDTDPVTEWKDSSGSGNDVTPPLNPPLYEKGGLLNKPTVLFEIGDGAFLRNPIATGFSVDVHSVFYLLERKSIGSDMAVMSYGNLGSFYSYFTNGNNRINLFRDGSGTVGIESNNVLFPNTPHLISQSYGATANVFERGLNATFASSTSISFGNTGNLEVGALVGGSNTFDGRISEILYFNNEISNADRFLVECYLSSKYGLALDASLNCD